MKNDSTLTYLRRLNPVSEAASVDGAELFERITSLPRDERPAPRRSATRRRVALVAVGLAVMALLATTAFAVANWFGDVVKPAVTKQEYKTAQSELTLPPGVTWPELNVDPNSVTSRGGGGSSAVMIAMGSWECYWVDAIKSGDEQAQQQAHAELNALFANHVFPVVAFADDGGYEFKQETYAKAAAGNPRKLIQSCRANGP
jgi:hypothetical protein